MTRGVDAYIARLPHGSRLPEGTALARIWDIPVIQAEEGEPTGFQQLPPHFALKPKVFDPTVRPLLSRPMGLDMGRKNARTNTGMSGARPIAIWHDEALSPQNQQVERQPNRQDRRAAARTEQNRAAAKAEFDRRSVLRRAKTAQARSSAESRA